FFCQAEDGIRDGHVTGVQTCALPICTVTTQQGDIRELPFKDGQFDVIVAAAVLHHLREDAEWETVFSRLHRSLRPGGSIWISDRSEERRVGKECGCGWWRWC